MMQSPYFLWFLALVGYFLYIYAGVDKMKKSKQKEQEKPKVNYGGYRTKYINCDCDTLENRNKQVPA